MKTENLTFEPVIGPPIIAVEVRPLNYYFGFTIFRSYRFWIECKIFEFLRRGIEPPSLSILFWHNFLAGFCSGMASDGHCCRACELTLWRAAVRKSLPREKIFSLFWKLLLKNNTQVHCVCIFSGAQWREFESERNTACFCENRKKGG